jgi:nucleoside-diphosphate-sugar epimerase
MPQISREVRRLICFGGNGFVGQAIMKAALTHSNVEEIIGVCRSGKIKDNMHNLTETKGYKDRVQWVKGDISALISRSESGTDPETWEGLVDESTGVISCVGMFALSNDTMRMMNGDANKALVETVKRAGAERMVFISAYEVEDKLPIPLIPGYFQGKRMAENAVKEEFGKKGTILQPGMVYGTRVQGGTNIPLGMIGKPLEALFSAPGLNQLQHVIPFIGKLAFSPPVSVSDVATAAVLAATGGLSSPNPEGATVLDIQAITTEASKK